MNKNELKKAIICQLKADHTLILQAAKKAHEAATHEENIPDNKYETLALEASYIAQGQANRAQEIGRVVQTFEALQLQSFAEESAIRLTALIALEDQNGENRWVFLVPESGGMRIDFEGTTVQLISAASPLGQGLIGSFCGDIVEVGDKQYEIVSID